MEGLNSPHLLPGYCDSYFKVETNNNLVNIALKRKACN